MQLRANCGDGPASKPNGKYQVPFGMNMQAMVPQPQHYQVGPHGPHGQ